MLESCIESASSRTGLLDRIQPFRAASVADTDSIWTAFEESSFFAVSISDESFYVPYLSALYTPGYFFSAEEPISVRSPLSAVGRSLPRVQLSLKEAEMSWFVALWLPCTGDADALLSDALLVFYGLSPLKIIAVLPFGHASPEALGLAATLVSEAGVRVPDLEVFIVSAS